MKCTKKLVWFVMLWFFSSLKFIFEKRWRRFRKKAARGVTKCVASNFPLHPLPCGVRSGTRHCVWTNSWALSLLLSLDCQLSLSCLRLWLHCHPYLSLQNKQCRMLYVCRSNWRVYVPTTPSSLIFRNVVCRNVVPLYWWSCYPSWMPCSFVCDIIYLFHNRVELNVVPLTWLSLALL